MEEGRQSRPPGVPDVGTLLLGKYRVEDLLGVGGMGSVVAARHEHLDERVALKLLHSVFASDPEVRKRFKREGPAAFKLRSEHVCRVFDAGELDDGTPFIAMELLEGETLSRVLEERKKLPLGEAIDIALHICEGLADAHANGVVHRDFKPSNLILTRRRDGSVCAKVIDFGISKMELAGVEMTHTFGFLGSPSYAAPEQLVSSKAATSRVDIWAVGIVLYYMLMGEHPFRVAGETFAVIATMITHDDPKPVCARDPSIPREVEAAIYRCLEKDPAHRWNDLRELAAVLAPFSSQPRPRWESDPSQHPTTPRLSERHLPPRDETTATGIMPDRIRRSGAPSSVLRQATSPTVITAPSSVMLPVHDPEQYTTGPQLPLPLRESARVVAGSPVRDSERLITGPELSRPSVPSIRASSLSATRFAPLPAPVPAAAARPAPSRWYAWAITGFLVVLTAMLLLKITIGRKSAAVTTAPPVETTAVPFTGAVAPGPVSTGVAIETGDPSAPSTAQPAAPIASVAAPAAQSLAPSRSAGRPQPASHAPRHPAPSDSGPKILKDWKGNF